MLRLTSVYIRFPVAGEATDAIIAEWACGVYQNARAEISELRKKDAAAEGEVNIQFDSYFVDSRYAGILENGMFMTSHLAHPISVVRTFNVDTKNGTLLRNSDILDYLQPENILALMREKIVEEYPEAAGIIGDMNEKWLEHITLSHDGVIVVLERSVFLPSYLGAVKVTLPYGQLGSAFVLGAGPTPEYSPEPPAEPPVKLTIPNVPPQSGNIDPSKPMVALTFAMTSTVLRLRQWNAQSRSCFPGDISLLRFRN